MRCGNLQATRAEQEVIKNDREREISRDTYFSLSQLATLKRLGREILAGRGRREVRFTP